MKFVKINTTETKKFYLEQMAIKKTIASKKAFLTKSLKQEQEYLNDLTEAINRSSKLLHGEIVTRFNVMQQSINVQIVSDLRAAL